MKRFNLLLFVFAYLLTILFMFPFLGTYHTFAQTKPTKQPPTADTLNRLTKEFIATYGNFSKTLNKESVLKYMDKNVSSLLTNTNISKNVVKFRSDYAGFSAYLDKLTEATKKEILLTYTLTNIIRTYTNEDMGVVTYTADYNIQKEKKLWTKGTETVVLAFKRLGAEWKIIHYTTTTIEDQKLVGECFCEYVENKDGSFDLITLIPAGKSYEEQKAKIIFEDFVENNTRIRRVRLDEDIYNWELSSELFYVVPSKTITTVIAANSQETISLGKMKTKQEVIEKILLNNFQESCQEVKSKRVVKLK
jgi:hypothetical protein